jgi:hypothetical protein
MVCLHPSLRGAVLPKQSKRNYLAEVTTTQTEDRRDPVVEAAMAAFSATTAAV